MRKHLKRLAMPKSWSSKKKGITYITKPSPGPHPIKLALPIKLILRDMLKVAFNSKEAKRILHEKDVLVDGRVVNDVKFPIGYMDSIELKNGNAFRVSLHKEKLSLIPIDKSEAGIKLCKIIGKSKIAGKDQLNFDDGRNILYTAGKTAYRVGDSVLISVPGNEIKEHIPLEKGCMVSLIGGKHIGETGHIEDIIQNKVTYKGKDGEIIETLKKYV